MIDLQYPKIETAFERDSTTFKVIPSKLRNKAFDEVRVWHWTEKIDGMNVRIAWDHEAQTVKIGSRTTWSNVPHELVSLLIRKFTVSAFVRKFPDTSVSMFGEGYGAGIQKGHLYSKTKEFALFDTYIHDPENNILGGWWLDWNGLADMSDEFGVERVPSMGIFVLEDAVDTVRVPFWTSTHPDVRCEGLVGKPLTTLYDAQGRRIIVKLKTKDFNGD